MNTRTIQITMFRCTLCPNLNLSNFKTIKADDIVFTCKAFGCKEISVNKPPEIPDWCPLPKDKVNIF